MSDTDLVRSACDAFGRGDLPAVLASCAPDIVWYSPQGTPWARVYRGPAEVAEFFRRLVGNVGSVSLQIDLLVEAGPGRVLVEGVDHYVIDGHPVDVGFAHVLLVRDGAVAGFTEYADVVALSPLLGAAR